MCHNCLEPKSFLRLNKNLAMLVTRYYTSPGKYFHPFENTLALARNMLPSFQLLSYTLLALTLAQASLSSNEQIEPKNAFLSPREVNMARELNATQQWNATRELYASQKLNATRKTNTTVGNKFFLDSSLAPPVEHVQLNASIIQTCDNGSGSPVIKDCSCSRQQLVRQAIDDAITMVQAVKGVWNSPAYGNILSQYMGKSCQNQDNQKWIDSELVLPSLNCNHSLRTATLANLANVKEYNWMPPDNDWLDDYSGDLTVYCENDLPPPQSKFTANCNKEDSMGWAYTLNNGQVSRPPNETLTWRLTLNIFQ